MNTAFPTAIPPINIPGQLRVHCFLAGPTTTNGFLENTAVALRAFCKDDDSLASKALLCVIFPDGPPPAPSSLQYAVDVINTVFKRLKTSDAYDGQGMEVEIYICDGTVALLMILFLQVNGQH